MKIISVVGSRPQIIKAAALSREIANNFKGQINEGLKTQQKSPFSINKPGVFHCGDVMYDNSLYFSEIAERKSNIIKELNLLKNEFILGTIHRDYNTDNTERLNNIFSTFCTLSEEFGQRIILALHPRTSQLINYKLEKPLIERIISSPLISLIPPVSFLDMIQLEKNAKLIMTGSGGVQKEAYFFNKPVIILRSETEWTEIVMNGAGVVTDASASRIIDAFKYFNEKKKIDFPPIFGDGKAANFI